MNTIKPKRLKKGDTIGIISPASAPLDLERINKGIIYLEKQGYHVKEGKYIRQEYGYLSGKDEERIEDIHNMFLDKHVKAIFCTRGGYGTPRLLNKINYAIIKRNPKILVGYSDITALQLAIFKKTGLITFSGAMLAVEMFKEFDSKSEEFFWKILSSASKIGKVNNPDDDGFISNNKGKASGLLLGGNLSMIISVFGTQYCPFFAKNILIFEDVEEEPYRIDRFLAQLRNSGVLEKINGLIIGSMTDCIPKDPTKPTLTLEQIFNDYLSTLKLPIIQNVKYGHIPVKLTIPIGIMTKIDAKKMTIEFSENAVQ
jgi:muramoyltetrapeptide carboxypeptidase